MNRNFIYPFPFLRNPLALVLAIPVLLFFLVIFLPLILLILILSLLFGGTAIRTFHFGNMNGNVPPEDSRKSAPDEDIIDVEVLHSDTDSGKTEAGNTHDPHGRNILE